MGRKTCKIVLYKDAPMDDTYANIFDYRSAGPETVLGGLATITMTGSYTNIYKPVRFKTSVVGDDYDTISHYNYMQITNNSKHWYCFVDHMEYQNDGMTLIYYRLDVWTTYWQNIDLTTTAVIDRATIEQSFTNPDVKRALGLNDPMLTGSANNSTITLAKLTNPKNKFALIYVMQPFPNGSDHRHSKHSTSKMFNGIRVYAVPLDPNDKYDDGWYTTINALQTPFQTLGGSGSLIIKAEIRDAEYLSESMVTGSKVGNAGEESFPTEALGTEDGDAGLKDFSMPDDGNSPDDVGKPYGKGSERSLHFVNGYPYAINGEANLTAVTKFHGSNTTKLGTISDLFKKLDVKNCKLISAPFTTLRIDTIYGASKDYDLASFSESQYGKEISVVGETSMEPNASVYYWVKGIGGNVSNGKNILIDNISRDIPIPYDAGLAKLAGSWYKYFSDEQATKLNLYSTAANIYNNQHIVGLQNRTRSDNMRLDAGSQVASSLMGSAGSLLGAVTGALTAGGLFKALTGAIGSAIDVEVMKEKADNMNKLSERIRRSGSYTGSDIASKGALVADSARLGSLADTISSNSVSMAGTFGNALSAASAGIAPIVYLATANRSYLDAADNFLSMYGNYIHRKARISSYFGKHNTGKGFAFIQTYRAALTGSAPRNALDTMSSALDGGVTVWSNIENFKQRDN